MPTNNYHNYQTLYLEEEKKSYFVKTFPCII